MVNANIEGRVIQLVHDLNLELGSIIADDTFVEAFASFIAENFQCDQFTLLAHLQREAQGLEHAISWPAITDAGQMRMLRSLFLENNKLEGENLLGPIFQGKLVRAHSHVLRDTVLGDIANLMPDSDMVLVPLCSGPDVNLIGLLIMEQRPATADDKRLPLDDGLLKILGTTGGAYLAHTLVHTQTVDMFSTSMHEMNILQQIDAELNDTIFPKQIYL